MLTYRMPTWLRIMYGLSTMTFLVFAGIGVMAVRESGPAWWWGVLVGLGVAAFSGWLLAHALRVAVMDVDGVVLTGPWARTIPYGDITAVREGAGGLLVEYGAGNRDRLFPQWREASGSVMEILQIRVATLSDEPSYPIVVHGINTQPWVFAVVCLPCTVLLVAPFLSDLSDSETSTRVFAYIFGPLVGGLAVLYLWWFATRRPVTVTYDTGLVNVGHLVGSDTNGYEKLVRAVTTVEERKLPRVSITRRVSHTRLVVDDGETVQHNPRVQSFPEYGTGPERTRSDRLTRHLNRLNDAVVKLEPVAYQTRWGKEFVLVEHDEIAMAAAPTTFMAPHGVAGRYAWVMMNGRIVIEDLYTTAWIWSDHRLLSQRLSDGTATEWVVPEGRVVIDVDQWNVTLGSPDGRIQYPVRKLADHLSVLTDAPDLSDSGWSWADGMDALLGAIATRLDDDHRPKAAALATALGFGDLTAAVREWDLGPGMAELFEGLALEAEIDLLDRSDRTENLRRVGGLLEQAESLGLDCSDDLGRVRQRLDPR